MGTQQTTLMPLAEHYEVVEAFLTDGADDPLGLYPTLMPDQLAEAISAFDA
jgi:hypothetical protein